jgi:hypothetical protein
VVTWAASEKKKNLSLRDKKWGISCKVVADIRTTYVPTVITTDKFSNGTPILLEQLDNTIRGGIMPITPPFDYDFNKKNSVTLAYRNRFESSAGRNAEYYDQMPTSDCASV